MRRHFLVRLLLAMLMCSGAFAADKEAAQAFKKYSAEAKKALKANDWVKARDLFQSAAEEAEKFGPEDSRLLETLHYQAEIYIQLRDYAEAEPVCRRMLEIREKKSGTNNLEVATDLRFLARVCGFTLKYEEAEIYLQRAQSILEWKLGAYDPMVGICLAERAQIYLMSDRLEEAETAYQKSIKLVESPRRSVNFAINEVVSESRSMLKPEYKAHLIGDLGIVHTKQKKFSEAEADFARAIKILEDQYGKESTALIGTLDNLGLTYLDEKKLPEAEAVVRRAWGIVKKSVKPGHPIVKETHDLLARILRDEGKTTGSKPSSKEAPALVNPGH